MTDKFQIWVDVPHEGDFSLYIYFPEIGQVFKLEQGEELDHIPEEAQQLVSTDLAELRARGNGDHETDAVLVNLSNARVDYMVSPALDAFWDSIKRSLGDNKERRLDPVATARLYEAARDCVIKWESSETDE